MRAEDPDEYFKFMRMTPDCFDSLLQKISPLISKKSFRKPISPGERLAVTLRYLASGDSMASLSYLFLMSTQVISKIIFETTAAIWYILREEVFEVLSQDFWRRKSAEFESMCQFPMCIGAIDGKHCTVQKFAMKGSELHNSKFTHSLILMAVTDAKYQFIAVDVGARGRESDAGVFARSNFGQLFLGGQLELPRPVYNDTIKSDLPYVFVGDDAFALHINLMEPFRTTSRPEEEIFNYRLSRARRVVENSFGIMSARFRVLRKLIIGSETVAQNIILACAALHNMHFPQATHLHAPGYADCYRSNGPVKEGRWRNERKQKEGTIFKKLCRSERREDIGNQYEVREKFMELYVWKPVPWQFDILTSTNV